MGEHAVKVGDTVQVGAMIATIDAGGGAAAPRPAAAPEPPPAYRQRQPPTRRSGKQPADAGSDDVPAALSPSVRRAVLEHGVDPATIKGTGKDGRITKEDVVAAARASPRRRARRRHPRRRRAAAAGRATARKSASA